MLLGSPPGRRPAIVSQYSVTIPILFLVLLYLAAAPATRKPQITVVMTGHCVTTKKFANAFAISLVLTSMVAVVGDGVEEKRPKGIMASLSLFQRALVLRLTRKGAPCCSGAATAAK